MISMSKAYSIRQLRMEGDSIAEISRKLEVSRDTVYKYLAAEDLSQRPPAPRGRSSVLDRYRPLIEMDWQPLFGQNREGLLPEFDWAHIA